MKLQDLMVDSKSAWIDYPGCSGLQFEIANLSRKELVALRKKCVTQKFDRKTRLMEETLDEERFIQEFSKATIKNWKGFKLKYLEDLLLVDLADEDPDDLLDYNPENAALLVQSSTEFDNWINEVVFDLANFRRTAK